MNNQQPTVQQTNPTTSTPTEQVRHWLTPAVDIFENEQGLTILADLPGVEGELLNLRIEQGVLSLEAAAPGLATAYGLSPAKPCGFFRRFLLPDRLDLDQIEADLKHGVLTLHLPKAAAAQPRQINLTVH